MKNILFILIFFPVFTQAQIINTVVGNGTGPYNGDNIAATTASIAAQNFKVDQWGNIYIADNVNERIRKVNTLGIITTIAGTGISGYNGDNILATTAEVNHPNDVVADAFGNVYIVDGVNNRIRKVDTSGMITTIAGTGGVGSGGDGGPATAAQFDDPYGIALDNNGNIYIADYYNNRIRKIDTAGVINTIAGTGGLGYSGDGGPADSAKLYWPSSVFADPYGNIFFTDDGNNVVRKIDTSGIISTIAGNGTAGYSGNGGPADSAELSNPGGITTDATGNIYIADNSNNVIRKVNPSGIITTFAGTDTAAFSGDGGLAALADINNPLGGSVYGNNYFFLDQGNYRIREIGLPATSTPNIIAINTNISVYPNPTVTSLAIQSTNQPINQITITNLLGQAVYLQTAPANCQLTQVDVSGLPAGVYFVKVNNTEVRKFVKE